MTPEGSWYEIQDNRSGPGLKRFPKWKRMMFVTTAGVLFVPAEIFMNDIEAAVCLGHDGESLLLSDGHVYVPIRWLAKERPEIANRLMAIEKDVLTLNRAKFQ